MSTATVSAICDALGRATMGARLGVGKTAISNAVVEGKFRASWFGVISLMCKEAGLDCPESIFSFREDHQAKTAGPDDGLLDPAPSGKAA